MSQSKRKKAIRFNTIHDLREAVNRGPAFKMILEAAELTSRTRDTAYYPAWRLQSKLPILADDREFVPSLLSEFAENVRLHPSVDHNGFARVEFTLLAEEEDILDVVHDLKLQAEHFGGIPPLRVQPVRYRYDPQSPRYSIARTLREGPLPVWGKGEIREVPAEWENNVTWLDPDQAPA